MKNNAGAKFCTGVYSHQKQVSKMLPHEGPLRACPKGKDSELTNSPIIYKQFLLQGVVVLKQLEH